MLNIGGIDNSKIAPGATFSTWTSEFQARWSLPIYIGSYGEETLFNSTVTTYYSLLEFGVDGIYMPYNPNDNDINEIANFEFLSSTW